MIPMWPRPRRFDLSDVVIVGAAMLEFAAATVNLRGLDRMNLAEENKMLKQTVEMQTGVISSLREQLGHQSEWMEAAQEKVNELAAEIEELEKAAAARSNRGSKRGDRK